ncbi:MAG: hypothetical protein QM831_14805 [Kofleriaceae bacterium]
MVIVLNGPSSAGKSTIANALRDDRTMICAIDQLFAMAPPAHPNTWALYAALTEATFGAAAGFARGGFDVIVDIVFERRTCFEIAERTLAGIEHAYIGVTAAIDVLERREATRGDRPAGLARRQHASVMHDVPYALIVDGAAPLADTITAIRAALPRR